MDFSASANIKSAIKFSPPGYVDIITHVNQASNGDVAVRHRDEVARWQSLLVVFSAYILFSRKVKNEAVTLLMKQELGVLRVTFFALTQQFFCTSVQELETSKLGNA